MKREPYRQRCAMNILSPFPPSISVEMERTSIFFIKHTSSCMGFPYCLFSFYHASVKQLSTPLLLVYSLLLRVVVFTPPLSIQLCFRCQTLELFWPWKSNLLSQSHLLISLPASSLSLVFYCLLLFSLISSTGHQTKREESGTTLQQLCPVFVLHVFLKKTTMGMRKETTFSMICTIFDLQIAAITCHDIPCKFSSVSLLMFTLGFDIPMLWWWAQLLILCSIYSIQ